MKFMSEEKKNLRAGVEALLFARAEEMTFSRLAKLLEATEGEIEAVCRSMIERSRREGAGIVPVINGDRVVLATAPEWSETVRQMLKQDLDEDLSRAALEVLAVVAYRQPVSRAEIESIRGVDCSSSLRKLLLRGLIARRPHPENSRAWLYEITDKFLRHLGLSRIEDLPEYEKMRDNEKIKTVLPAEEENK